MLGICLVEILYMHLLAFVDEGIHFMLLYYLFDDGQRDSEYVSDLVR